MLRQLVTKQRLHPTSSILKKVESQRLRHTFVLQQSQLFRQKRITLLNIPDGFFFNPPHAQNKHNVIVKNEPLV